MSNEVLVTTEWALAHLDDAKVVFIEVDEDTAIYETNHIRNAIRLDWRNDLQDKVRRDFVNAEQFSALLSLRGVNNDDTVVLYGGNNNWFAAYAYWYFKLYGHQNVRLLDGGRKKWELDGLELVSEIPNRTASKYVAKEQDLSLRAFRDDVVKAIGSFNLVDVRSLDAGFDYNKETIAYCRIGERSAHSWFVLHELLGLSKVKNYDGSWTEYGSLVGVPVAIGDEPGQA